ncbi:HlyD family type I secretion periplasmic adaptor subunit [Undibacterium sp. LX40W]|uniref:Membrane fusion protein (MFP) family protein n=1 Tax=Undibacterium nitidum TaxID=2762298 RepID=A0A923HLR5_9BURK|nr:MULTISPECIES: HlyD family type I secretion periplasmic adaptor subunit [Undibacterium]MBC3881719.1 HlyD family type I secretion periplasmic adaptor subunit [Undibacterium nitidum]MBC3892284.1 HlyD family type I secretion periplasmic adaptor subunit [Undibacterium sp. LX40W]
MNTKNALVKRDNNVSDVATQDVEVLDVIVDSSSYSRLGWMIVLFGFVGFILWASFAPLDKGVPIQGTLSVSSNRKAIQYPNNGTVEAVLVKDGDVVKAGQVLVRMNPIVSKANLEVGRVQLYTAEATAARLKAEIENAPNINFPKYLTSDKLDPRVANNILLQQQLFLSRRTAQQNDLSSIDENIAGLKSQLRGLEDSMINKKQQVGFLKEQVENMRELAKEGFVARNRLLDLERTYAQVIGAISEDTGNIGRVQRQITELNFRRTQRQQEYQKEARAQLNEAQKDAESARSRLPALEYEFNNVEVKSPVNGVVTSLNVFTVGGFVAPNVKLMEIVPESDPLIVEGQMPVHLVDKVRKGMPVDLIFSAFNSNTTPHIPGVVTQVAADRTVDERTGMPYYKIRAEVTPEGVKKLTKLELRPGMPVDMSVKTGERTFMNYLMKPLMDRANSSLSEE